MYKAVLFDLDGTLLNTVPDIQKVLNFSLSHFNLPQISVSQAAEYVGNGAYMLVKRACGGAEDNVIDEVYKFYSKEFAACDNSLSAYYDGERETLKRFKDAGVKMGIITNKPQQATLNVYEKFFKEYDFFMVQGQEEGIALKPSPDVLLAAISKLKINREECLFVGDGETDVQTAINAKVNCASVLWGYRTKTQLKKAGAKLFCESFVKLEEIVLKRG